MRKALYLVVTLSCLTAELAAGQTVQRRGRGDPRLEPKLAAALAANPQVLARDTFIARTDTLRGPVLSLGNRLVIEGTILGDLTVVDANVYVRPTARIEGGVLNIGSGLYRSEQATIAGRVDDHALAPYHVDHEDGVHIIVGDVDYKPFKLAPLAPTADRVNGVRPRLGIKLEAPPMGRVGLELYAWGAYSFERSGWQERLQGGVEARARRGFTHVAVGFEETTATNDEWIRSDLKNALSFMYNGKDYRNYYDAQRVYAMVARELIRGNHAAIASVRVQREDAASLTNRSPWVLLEPDSIRSNPFVNDGRIDSGILSVRGDWKGLTNVVEYEAGLEVGSADARGYEGGFQAVTLTGEWAMQALANHTLEIETRLQMPLGADSLPRQRWGMLGGSSTIYTFELGEFLGDRVVYVESEYSIPIDRIKLPVIGTPALEFIHIIGKAWSHGQSGSLEQNIGAKIQFPMAYVRFVVNPADLDQQKFSVGVNFPRSAYPWEKKPSR